MNKIFKVIWSKSKQCYVVVSEMAKNTTGKKKIVVAGILASLAISGGLNDVQAVDAPGNRGGFSSSGTVGTAFNPTEGTVLGPSMPGAFDQTTRAKGNVATVAIGAHSEAFGGSSVAMGGGTAYGDKAGTKGNVANQGGAVALGWVTAKGNRAVALGGIDTTSATGDNAFAASGGVADGDNTFAVSGGNASKSDAIAVGSSATAAETSSIALGKSTQAKSSKAIAVGEGATADGTATIAIGAGNNATGWGATAIGKNVQVTKERSTGLGWDLTVDQSGSTLVGYNSQVHANQGTLDYYVQSIYFDSDQDVARADQYPNLTAAVNAANQYSQDQIKLLGNADTDATPQYNVGLSERRVQYVAQYLVNNGVSADRFIGIANGDTKPVATNSTAAGKAENRRVDVYIHR